MPPHRGRGKLDWASLKEAAQAQLGIDGVQFELRPLQPRAPSTGIARVVVGNPTLRRLHSVLCALQIDDGVLSGFRLCACPARSFARMAALNCFAVAIGTLRLFERTVAIKYIQRSFAN
jgi:hypothetical protein